MEEIKVADTGETVAFYAYQSSDHISPATGITGHVVDYFLRNGSRTLMTTPTVTEKDATNMPGWYTLAVDEAGMVSSAGVTSIDIKATGMDPVPIKVLIIGNTTKEVYDAVVPTTHCSTSGTVNTGSVDSGTHSDTCTENSTYWTILHSGGTIDVELGFGIGVNRVPTSVDVLLVSSVTGTLTFYAYNYLTSTWDQLNYPSYGAPDVGGTYYRFSLLQDQVDVDGSSIIRLTLTGLSTSDKLFIDKVNVKSIGADSIANGVKLGAQGKSDVNAEADTALSDYDGPSNTEMVDAFTEIKGATWAAGSDTLEHIRDKQTDIETDTAEIGTAGAGLTDLGGMSTGMKAEVQTEANDALIAQNLDHLVKYAVDTNFATTVHLDSVVGQMADVGTSATFDRTTDSQEAIRDKQTDIETDTAEIGTAGAGLTALGDSRIANLDTTVSSRLAPAGTLATVTNLTNAPTNGDLTATMKASVQTECDTSLTSYGANTTVPDVAGTAATLHGITDGKVDTAQSDLDKLTGTDGATLATAQGNYAPNKVVPDVAGTAAGLHTTTDGKVDAVQTDATAIKAKTDNLPSGIAKNVALANFKIFMVLSSDHATAATGKTLTGTIQKDAGAFAALTNSITEISHGSYMVDLTQAEMNADTINLLFTETDCDDQPYTVYTT